MANVVRDGFSQLRQTGGVGSPVLRAVLPVVAGAIVLLLLLSTTITYIHPGHVGIVISRTGGGVEKIPLAAGLHTRNPLTTGIEEYPIYMQTLVLAKSPTEGATQNEEINVNSVEGQPISLDVAMSFELDPMQVPELYSTFRNDIDFIQHNYVKQTIRQALQEVIGGEAIADILGPKKAEVVNRAQILLEKRLSPYGFVVKQFTINEIRAPQSVIDAINAKNVMQQAALTFRTSCRRTCSRLRGIRSRRSDTPKPSSPRPKHRPRRTGCSPKASHQTSCPTRSLRNGMGRCRRSQGARRPYSSSRSLDRGAGAPLGGSGRRRSFLGRAAPVAAVVSWRGASGPRRGPDA